MSLFLIFKKYKVRLIILIIFLNERVKESVVSGFDFLKPQTLRVLETPDQTFMFWV